jgi:hypothetical protein
LPIISATKVEARTTSRVVTPKILQSLSGCRKCQIMMYRLGS